jgi:hypothetical protein
MVGNFAIAIEVLLRKLCLEKKVFHFNVLIAASRGFESFYSRMNVSVSSEDMDQGCQMVCFQTKNPDLGKFWRVLLWKILVYFMTIWYILRPLEIIYGHLVYFVVIWNIFPRFGILDQQKSGNPDMDLPNPVKFASRVTRWVKFRAIVYVLQAFFEKFRSSPNFWGTFNTQYVQVRYV